MANLLKAEATKRKPEGHPVGCDETGMQGNACSVIKCMSTSGQACIPIKGVATCRCHVNTMQR